MGLLSVLGGVAGAVIGGGPVGASIGAALGGALEGGQAAAQAGQTQVAAAQGGMDEQRRQFEEFTRILQPYTQVGLTAVQGLAPYAEAGAPALEQQQALLGLRGPQAEREAISRISGGETFQALARQGEEALLQRASATGGLRGGNIQAALAQFRPQLLSGLIEQQYGRLGGLAATGQTTQAALAGLGQASAARQAAAGQQTAANISGLLGQQGSAQAASQLAQQRALTQGVVGGFGALQGAGVDLGSIFRGTPTISQPINLASGEYMGSLEF
jgi:hypothetical protein